MMNVHRLNDAPVLDQLEGHWQKIVALIIWKLQGEKRLEITGADIEWFNREWEKRGGAIVFTHGMHDRLAFQVVDIWEAERLAEHQQKQRGSA